MKLRFMQKDNIKLTFDGKEISKSINHQNNRYFITINDLIYKLGGNFKIKDGRAQITVRNKNISFDIVKDKYKVTILNELVYMSLFDIVSILNLKVRWNYKTKEIALFWNKDKSQPSLILNTGKTALIRFEDVTAGGPYNSAESLEKVRIMVDYLYSKAIPFHAAWIPRYVNPPENINNDLARDYSMSNADFLYTLDYMISRNGMIGLHGYTHQYDEEVSADGTEFNEERNNDEESARQRIELAIGTAKALEIPYGFFESPHYASTAFQQSIFEQYVDYIYEPYVGIWGNKVTKSPRNHRTLYIPTPLSYVTGPGGTEKMILRIKELPEGIIGSLFYHPSKEMSYISLTSGKNGYPTYSYSESSTLRQIVDTLLNRGYKPVSISDLK